MISAARKVCADKIGAGRKIWRQFLTNCSRREKGTGAGRFGGAADSLALPHIATLAKWITYTQFVSVGEKDTVENELSKSENLTRVLSSIGPR